MKTVIIIGAGVSRAAGNSLSIGKRPPLDADFFEISKHVDKQTYYRVEHCIKSFVGGYYKSLMGSLESTASYLYLKAVDSTKGDLFHQGFLDLLLLLNRVLARTTNPLKVGPRSLIYRFLLSELSKVENFDDFSIITFNYDLLVERALNDIDINGHNGVFKFPGCYRLNGLAPSSVQKVNNATDFNSYSLHHSGAAIYKLHGSLNWQSRHTSDSPTARALFSPQRELHVINSTQISPQLYWRRRERMVYMKPIIVPPVSGKRGTIHNDMLPIWRQAANALRKADRVIIAGYSCPPLDIEARILISENLRANQTKKVYIINPNTYDASRFSELCGTDHLTIYGNINDWVRDAR